MRIFITQMRMLKLEMRILFTNMGLGYAEIHFYLLLEKFIL